MAAYKIGLSEDFAVPESSQVLIPFDTVNIGPEDVASEYNTENYTFNPNIQGSPNTFLVTVSLEYAQDDWAALSNLYIKLTTASTTITRWKTIYTAGSQVVDINYTTLIIIPYNSYLKVQAYQNSGGVTDRTIVSGENTFLDITQQKLQTLSPFKAPTHESLGDL